MVAIACVAAVLMADAGAGQVAKSRALVLDQAFKKYYTENGKWPAKLKDVAAYLEDEKEGLLDPWGKEYKFEIREQKAGDRTVPGRPYIWTERVVGKETRVYGKKPDRS